jgi:4-hydroxy-tetrahydrodipicolinate reductase
MDKLVVTLMSACDEVRAVHVTRLVDAATRRVPFQRKVGAGLTREAFEERLRQGRFGHVGLPETAHMLADAMGLPPAREVRTTIGPVIAERAHESGAIPVQPGQVAGLEQSLVLEAAGVQRVRLEMRMAVGEPEPRDAVVIDGSPPLAMTVSTGVAGDEGTAAVVLACLPLVGALEPGLRTMLDVPIRPPWRG